MFVEGDKVEIVGSNSGKFEWYGLRAEVLPWPEDEEQYEDGELNNWLKPLSKRPDIFEMSEFMWPTVHLRLVQE